MTVKNELRHSLEGRNQEFLKYYRQTGLLERSWRAMLLHGRMLVLSGRAEARPSKKLSRRNDNKTCKIK